MNYKTLISVLCCMSFYIQSNTPKDLQYFQVSLWGYQFLERTISSEAPKTWISFGAQLISAGCVAGCSRVCDNNNVEAGNVLGIAAVGVAAYGLWYQRRVRNQWLVQKDMESRLTRSLQDMEEGAVDRVKDE